LVTANKAGYQIGFLFFFKTVGLACTLILFVPKPAVAACFFVGFKDGIDRKSVAQAIVEFGSSQVVEGPHISRIGSFIF
jgi:hypothetical protein